MAKTTVQGDTAQVGRTSSTPNVPDWLLDPAKRLAGGVGSVLDQGPDPFAPKITSNQTGAWDAGAGLQGADYSEPNSILRNGGGAGSIAAHNIKGESLLTGLEDYYNPFKDQITNPVLNDFDAQAGQTRAGQAAEAARNKAFQGSRYGIQEAETEGQLARGRAATEGGLLKDMFSESTRLSGEDAGRRQDASRANQMAALQADMSNQQTTLANERLGIDRAAGLSSNIGAADASNLNNLKTRTDIANNEADRRDAVAQYPIEYLKQAGGLFEGMNPSQYFGTTTDIAGATSSDELTKQKLSPLDWFGNALTAAAGSSGKVAGAA